MNNLRKIYHNTAKKYSEDDDLISKLFSEIEVQYNSSCRFYHNFSHIGDIIRQIENVKTEIKDWDTIVFAVFYHDFVYDVKSKSNEEDSARMAKIYLSKLEFPEAAIEKCQRLILATREHSRSDDIDINLFVDSDLSILGQETNIYIDYIKRIRKEYSIYPDTIYNEGRINVLNHMLNMETIYKTGYFYDKLEKKARENIAFEIKSLVI